MAAVRAAGFTPALALLRWALGSCFCCGGWRGIPLLRRQQRNTQAHADTRFPRTVRRRRGSVVSLSAVLQDTHVVPLVDGRNSL